MREGPGGARVLHDAVAVRLCRSKRGPDRAPGGTRPLVVSLRVNQSPALREPLRVIPRERFHVVRVVVVAEDHLQLRVRAHVAVHVVREGLEVHVRVARRGLVPGFFGFAVVESRLRERLRVEVGAETIFEELVEADVVDASAVARRRARGGRRDEIFAHRGHLGEVGVPKVLVPGVEHAVSDCAESVGAFAVGVGLRVVRLDVFQDKVIVSLRHVDGQLDLGG